MLLPGEVLTKHVLVRKSAEVIVVTGKRAKPKIKRAIWRSHSVMKELNIKLFKFNREAKPALF